MQSAVCRCSSPVCDLSAPFSSCSVTLILMNVRLAAVSARFSSNCPNLKNSWRFWCMKLKEKKCILFLWIWKTSLWIYSYERISYEWIINLNAKSQLLFNKIGFPCLWNCIFQHAAMHLVSASHLIAFFQPVPLQFPVCWLFRFYSENLRKFLQQTNPAVKSLMSLYQMYIEISLWCCFSQKFRHICNVYNCGIHIMGRKNLWSAYAVNFSKAWLIVDVTLGGGTEKTKSEESLKKSLQVFTNANRIKKKFETSHG